MIHRGLLPRPPAAAPTDWRAVDQSLCREYGWTPQQIDEMTVPEIRVACGTRADATFHEKLQHMKAKEQLTVEEKLLAMQIAGGIS